MARCVIEDEGKRRFGAQGKLDAVFIFKICECQIYFLHLFCRKVLDIGGQMRDPVWVVKIGEFPIGALDVPFGYLAFETKKLTIPHFVIRVLPRLYRLFVAAITRFPILPVMVARLIRIFFDARPAVVEPAWPVKIRYGFFDESAIDTGIILIDMLN